MAFPAAHILSEDSLNRMMTEGLESILSSLHLISVGELNQPQTVG